MFTDETRRKYGQEITIRFFGKSFKVISPIITVDTFYIDAGMKKTFLDADRERAFEFVGDLIAKSIALGKANAQQAIRIALGLSL